MQDDPLQHYDLVSLPGYHGSSADHWQTLWESRYPAMRRVEGIDWERPDAAVWGRRLLATAAERERPVIVVAHSFGVLATAWASRYQDGLIHGALLVAPAEPRRFGIEKTLPHLPLLFPTYLVASSDDPWMSIDRARYWADAWDSEWVEAGALGHINADSGLGDWALGRSLLGSLARRADDEPRFIRPRHHLPRPALPLPIYV